METRPGLPMSKEELAEWKQAFIDIEESINNLDLQEKKNNPYAKYLRMKQQELF